MQPVQDLTVETASAARSTSTRSRTERDELATGRRSWSPKLKKLPELRDVASDQQNGGLQRDAGDRPRHRSRLGITPQTIDDTLYDAFGQRQVSTMFTQLNQYHVILEVKPELPARPIRSATSTSKLPTARRFR
jgi:multidrug efflux pump